MDAPQAIREDSIQAVLLLVAENGETAELFLRNGLQRLRVGVKLFHRHARGLILTEQGELLYRTARDMAAKVNTAEALLRPTNSALVRASSMKVERSSK